MTLANAPGRRVAMELVVEVAAAVTGMALGVGAARVVLGGLLSFMFGRRA